MALKNKATILNLAHLNNQGTAYGRRMEAHCRQVFKMTTPDPNQPDRRKLQVVKSNSKPPAPLGVTMGDRGNDYDTNPPTPADEPGRSKVASKVKEAMDWLKERLRNGPEQVVKIREEAEDKGIRSGTLYRARDELEIVESTNTVKGKTRKVWTLPDGAEGQDSVPF
jgi:hypothetical protein